MSPCSLGGRERSASRVALKPLRLRVSFIRAFLFCQIELTQLIFHQLVSPPKKDVTLCVLSPFGLLPFSIL